MRARSDILDQMKHQAESLIEAIEGEKSGVRDGDGFWHGSDPLSRVTTLSELYMELAGINLTDKERRRIRDGLDNESDVFIEKTTEGGEWRKRVSARVSEKLEQLESAVCNETEKALEEYIRRDLAKTDRGLVLVGDRASYRGSSSRRALQQS